MPKRAVPFTPLSHVVTLSGVAGARRVNTAHRCETFTQSHVIFQSLSERTTATDVVGVVVAAVTVVAAVAVVACLRAYLRSWSL